MLTVVEPHFLFISERLYLMSVDSVGHGRPIDILLKNKFTNCKLLTIGYMILLPCFTAALRSLSGENHTPRFHLFNRSIRLYIL